jgi:hypothetical protein
MQCLNAFVAVFYPEKFYGFLTTDQPGTGKEPGIHFSARDCVPDWKGSTAHVWSVPGTPVTYRIIERPSKKYSSTWKSAIDVRPLFLEEPSESLKTYREVSWVKEWNGCYGLLARSCGDTLFIHRSQIQDQSKVRLFAIKVGDWIYHGAGKRDDERWHATNIELFSEAEQARLQRGLPAQEPEPEPEPVPVPVAATPEFTSVLAPATRNKPLIQLILERGSRISK